MRISAAALALALAASASADDRDTSPTAVALVTESLAPGVLGTLFAKGRLEMARYEVQRVVDGVPVAGRLTISTEWMPVEGEHRGEADWPYGQKPHTKAVRQVQFAQWDAPAPGASTQATLIVPGEDAAHPVKLDVSLHEPKGTTFKTFELWRERPTMRYFTPFDTEGSGERALDTRAGLVYEEQLPMLVRALPMKEGSEAALWLMPSQLEARAAKPEPREATLRIGRPSGDVSVRAGAYKATAVWEITVDAMDGRRLVYDVADDRARTLLLHATGDGRAWELVETWMSPSSSESAK